MRNIYLSIIAISLFMSAGCSYTDHSLMVSSPNKNIAIEFFLTQKGEPAYFVKYKHKLVIDTSKLGFDLKTAGSLNEGFELYSEEMYRHNEIWDMVWGEQNEVFNNYDQLKVELIQSAEPYIRMDIIFRAFDDGVAFRYEFPEQEISDVVIIDENTEFNLTGDHTCWWIPGDWDIYEHLYNTNKVSEINALAKANHSSLAQTYIPENAVNTPVTMKTTDGVYLSFHEADLTDYSGMTLKIDTENLLMQSELVGSRDGSKVKRDLPFHSPWRTIQIADRAGNLIESKMILNLNEPNKIHDVSWIKPQKYIGIWWEMHLGKSSWDMAGGRHGATTENTKRFIDFAAKNKIDAVLVEGWNTGWEHWIGFEDREGVFDFITPYNDYDLEKVAKYAHEKGVQIIMHNETSSAPRTYEQQLDTAFALYKRLGMHSIKSGYVGKIIPKGEYHHGQWMVNHYRKVLEKAAEYQIMVDAHEPIKDTGIRRTYPNMMTREGLRGQEFNAWSSDGGNPPEHLTIVPFTRMLAGPIDYTPGIFDIKFDKYKKNNQVNTTIAHQLALYVVIYSPLQMAADLLENYEGHHAFQFIKDVGIDWDESKVLNSEIGDYVTIVRKEKNTGNWFLGSITDENPRELKINLDFLDEDINYKAVIYKDADDAHWDKNPTAYKIEEKIVSADQTLILKLAEGGGTAISFFPVSE